ncbi:hypothetical protein [Aromatoleum evansii]|uniref:hypothetical protein n=1 Tax=Aromatoleum evansii TaxID=59406 RepID=UPI00145C5D76|nr:hypothetical protein [Aromatoleum evansii]NMG30009.1 hypothetical protein [Aromatoleum evansii]
MQRLKPCGLFALLAVLANPAVAAQHVNERPDSPPAASPEEATRPAAPALAGYRPFTADEPMRDWRAANAEVGRLKGHGGHLRDATKPSGEAPHKAHGGPQ